MREKIRELDDPQKTSMLLHVLELEDMLKLADRFASIGNIWYKNREYEPEIINDFGDWEIKTKFLELHTILNNYLESKKWMSDSDREKIVKLSQDIQLELVEPINSLVNEINTLSMNSKNK